MAARTARGMRDFLPAEVLRRRRAMERLRAVFERYGFEPLETPAVESLETLLGKYGEEGDALIFRILKRGEGGRLGEADLGLRYDLTVPLARVVAQHQAELPMPFRRYQMQPVWRADRPAQGRFREFYQCDVDIVGAASVLADAEILALTHDGLQALDLGEFAIQLNHRGVLHAVVETSGVGPDLAEPVLVTLDKLDKVGPDGVMAEWAERGVTRQAVDAHLAPLLALGGTNDEVLEGLANLFRGNEQGTRAVSELRELLGLAAALGVAEGRLRVVPSLARGLSYYTGPIFEAVVAGAGGGSITGGGRYDGLVERLGGPALPATGTSFGLERILALLEQRGEAGADPGVADLYVALPWPETVEPTLGLVRALRAEGLRVLVGPGPGGKLLKHFQQAERRGIRWVAFLGPDEAAAGRACLRDVRGREQSVLAVAEIAQRLRGGGAS